MRRRTGFLCIFGAAIPLVVFASTAWACGVLATLKAAPSSVAVGQTVGVTGVNYSSDMAAFTPVQIRLDSRSGPVLKEVVPNQARRISTTINVPAGTASGDHLLIATQNSIASGTPKSGTPGRTTMRVQGAAASSAAASPWSSSKPGAPSGSTASIDARGSGGDSVFLGIALSLALLSVGVTLVGRDRATRSSRPSRRPLLGA